MQSSDPIPLLTALPEADLAQRCAELEQRVRIVEAMLQDAQHGIALFDANRLLVHSNNAFAKLTLLPPELLRPGVPREAMRHFAETNNLLSVPLELTGALEDLEVISAHRAKAHTSRSHYGRRRHDGRVIELVETTRPDGSVVVTLFDVTSILQTRHDADERGAVLDAVMNNARFGLTVFDAEHRLRARNQMARQFSPFPDMEVPVGTKYEDILANIENRAVAEGNVDANKWRDVALSVDRSKPLYYSRPGFRGGWVDLYSDPTPDGGFIITHIDVSELKSARDAEMRLAEIHRKMLDTMSQGIIIYDENYNLLACNELAAEMTCNNLEDFTPGSSFDSIVKITKARGGFGLGPDADAAEAASRQADRKRPLALQRVNALGRVILAQSVPNLDGGFVITYTDVTQLAQAERAERERAELLHTTLNSIQHGFKAFGPDQRLRMTNPLALLQSPPYPSDQPAPTYAEMVDFSLRQGVFGIGRAAQELARSLMQMDRRQPHRKILSLATGRKYEFFLTPLPDGGFVVSNLDVTALVNARLASDAATKELQALIEAMPGVLIRQRRNSDGGWHRFYVSDRLTSLTGHTALEASDPKWVINNVDPGDYPNLLEGVELAFNGGQSVAEFQFRRKNGQWIWIRAMMRGNVDSTGLSEAICIWSDITRERELKAQVAHSRRLAQMGEVATGMAHEMNQPLASISIAAENAMRALGRLPNSVGHLQDKLMVIANQAHRAAAMIDHVQAFSRYGDEPTTSVRLQAVLANVIEQTEPILARHNVRLISKLEDDLSPALGREGLLERALANLIVNACEAYDRHPEIDAANREITLASHVDGQYIHLTVRDQAGGIDPETLSHVFEPFFTTKPVGQGTGLGLSVAYGIVIDVGGTMSAHNVDGGAEFDVVLMRADPRALRIE